MSMFDRKNNSFFNSSTFYFFGISLAFIIFVYRVCKRLMSIAASPAFYVGLGVLLLTIVCVQNTDVMLPFLLAFILAYFGNPLVIRIMRTGLPRVMAVSIVFSLIFIGLGTLIFVSIPALQAQITNLIYQLPGIINLCVIKINWILHHFGTHELNISADSIKKIISDKMPPADQMASIIWSTTVTSGKTLISGVIDVVIVPFVTFYLLLDWVKITTRMKLFIAKHCSARARLIISESESSLNIFFRGQLTVVLIMTIFYMFGMSLAGLNIGLVIGLIMGLLTIVPYVGSIIGLSLASLAAIAQSGSYTPLVWVLTVYFVGHILENFYVSPKCIGDKIGMHPILVIFIILLGGKVASIWGIVLALPLSSVAMVLFKNTNASAIES